MRMVERHDFKSPGNRDSGPKALGGLDFPGGENARNCGAVGLASSRAAPRDVGRRGVLRVVDSAAPTPL
jgi:hypothetical protein